MLLVGISDVNCQTGDKRDGQGGIQRGLPMKWLTFEVQTTPGFRFNLTDAAFLVVLSALSGAIYYLVPDDVLWPLPLYIGLTFLLFCNVFRIGNRLESVWYIPFTLVTVASIYCQDATTFWLIVAFVFEPLKWLLIAYRLIRGPYMGVGFRRFGNSHRQHVD